MAYGEPCGSHENNSFDYTCDDCMLQEPHLDPEDEEEE